MAQQEAPDFASGQTWAERHYRALRIAVIVMGILLVAGFIVVLGTIITRMGSGPASSGAGEVARVTALPPSVARLLGPESEIVDTVLDGSRLALISRHSGGHGVIVIDLRSGQIINVIEAE